MSRPVLDETKIAKPALDKMSSYHKETLDEVRGAVASEPLVVVGMAQNPHVKRVRRALEAAGHPFKYLEYGSYFSAWKPRLAIKLWSGWPTFPQVFAKGELLGGRAETEAAIQDGSLKAKLG